MKNLNSIAFKKSNKKNTMLLVLGIVLLLGALVCLYFGISYENKEKPELINLKESINNKNYKENIYSYLDISMRPYVFAVYEENGKEEIGKYYFVMDDANKLYIIYIDKTTYSKLNKEEIKDNPVKITGITKKIPNDIKDIAIESYNEYMQEEYLTKDNFKDYVGIIYLDTVTNLYDSTLYYIGSGFIGLISLILITSYIIIFIKNKKIFKKLSQEEIAKIDAEIEGLETSKYNNMKFYLLKDSLVDTSNYIIAVKYKEIVWAYPYVQRYNGLPVNKCIRIVTKDKKKYNVANTKIINKEKDKILDEIIEKLKEKNKDIILGYSLENKKEVKEKLRKKKVLNIY